MRDDDPSLRRVRTTPELGDGSWYVVDGLAGDVEVFVRMGLDTRHRSVVQEVVVRSNHRVASDQVQRLPLATLERLANRPLDGEQLRDMLVSTGPVLRDDPEESAEAFADRVARRYALHAALTRSPAKAMADESEVPVSRVHRWVREARRLGKLAPGRQGTAG
ncbi:hypothetical protein PHK61_18685 [Actinomycetospora lutea]|uniref:hypothetical protein n=1 Tax=Actinomycetospora lutea TaxID=663604 RepID=UPI0023655B11|nr:hypothetical protein [Actinomycetospora lutea]MDD7940455.1 hypothetical protein [Actinomycetospora lutea]